MNRKTRPWSRDLKAVVGAEPDPERGLPRESQTFEGEARAVRYANFVRLPHTVFALPFALLGVVYASTVQAVTVTQGVLVIAAFAAARFVAMGFNRIVDRDLDARNPRTQGRELPSGRLSNTQAGGALGGGGRKR